MLTDAECYIRLKTGHLSKYLVKLGSGSSFPRRFRLDPGFFLNIHNQNIFRIKVDGRIRFFRVSDPGNPESTILSHSKSVDNSVKVINMDDC